jgi:hypothetical protein
MAMATGLTQDELRAKAAEASEAVLRADAKPCPHFLQGTCSRTGELSCPQGSHEGHIVCKMTCGFFRAGLDCRLGPKACPRAHAKIVGYDDLPIPSTESIRDAASSGVQAALVAAKPIDSENKDSDEDLAAVQGALDALCAVCREPVYQMRWQLPPAGKTKLTADGFAKVDASWVELAPRKVLGQLGCGHSIHEACMAGYAGLTRRAAGLPDLPPATTKRASAGTSADVSLEARTADTEAAQALKPACLECGAPTGTLAVLRWTPLDEEARKAAIIRSIRANEERVSRERHSDASSRGHMPICRLAALGLPCMTTSSLGSCRFHHILPPAGKRGKPGSRGPTGADASAARGSSMISVATQRVGRVIGRGGETVRGLARDTNCRIIIARESAPDDLEQRSITIVGSDENRAKAEARIRELVAE